MQQELKLRLDQEKAKVEELRSKLPSVEVRNKSEILWYLIFSSSSAFKLKCQANDKVSKLSKLKCLAQETDNMNEEELNAVLDELVKENTRLEVQNCFTI